MPQRRSTNNFLPILDNWKEYFDDPHEGLGTTYERFLLHQYFDLINRTFHIETVLEVPIFGMTGVSGINSLWWARQGKKVYLLDDNEERVKRIREIWEEMHLPVTINCLRDNKLPYKSQTIDLVWNFAALWFVQDLSLFANSVKEITNKVIFICVPNMEGIGFRLRKRISSIPKDIYLESIVPAKVEACFTDNQWCLWEKGIFDVPPWPDIPLKKEEILSRLTLGIIGSYRNKNLQKNRKSARLTIMDYFSEKDPQMENIINRYGLLENTPKIIKRFWGHHRYFIFKKEI